MSILALVLVIAGAFGTLAGAAAAFWWLIKPRVQEWAQEQIIGPIHETRHQVTVNHHSSANPTILDRLDDVHSEVGALRTEQVRVRADLTKHLLAAHETDERVDRRLEGIEAAMRINAEAQTAVWPAIEAVARAEPPSDA